MEKHEFEKGKQLFVDGIEALFKMYEPYVNMAQAIQMLGLTDYMGADPSFIEKYSDIGLWKIGINTILNDLRNAKNVEELKTALEDNRKFWDLTGIFREEK